MERTRRSKAAAGETVVWRSTERPCACLYVQLKAREPKAGSWVDQIPKATWWRDP